MNHPKARASTPISPTVQIAVERKACCRRPCLATERPTSQGPLEKKEQSWGPRAAALIPRHSVVSEQSRVNGKMPGQFSTGISVQKQSNLRDKRRIAQSQDYSQVNYSRKGQSKAGDGLSPESQKHRMVGYTRVPRLRQKESMVPWGHGEEAARLFSPGFLMSRWKLR